MSFLDKSYILNYVSKNASSTIKNRAKSLIKEENWRLVDSSLEKQSAHFKLASATGYEEYDVKLFNVFSPNVKSTCNCPYTWGSVCKHEVAILTMLADNLEDIFEEEEEEEVEEIPIPAKATQNAPGENITFIKLGKISHLINYANTSGKQVNKAETYLKFGYIEKLEIIDTKATVEVFDGVGWFHVSIERKSNTELRTQCVCPDNSYNLCEHKISALLYIRKLKGEYIFEQLKDHSIEKMDLLADYGFTLEDKWQDKFRFNFQDGKLVMHLLDKSLRKLSVPADWKSISDKISSTPNLVSLIKKNQYNEEFAGDWETGYGFYFAIENELPDVQIVKLIGKVNSDGNRFKSAIKDLSQIDIEMLPPMDEISYEINHLLKKISKHNVANFLGRGQNSYLFYETYKDDEFLQGQQHLMQQFEKLIPFLEEKIVGELAKKNIIKIANFIQFDFSNERPDLIFELNERNNFLELTAFMNIDDELIPLENINRKSFLFITYEDRIYLLAKVNSAFLFSKFLESGSMVIHKNSFIPFYREMLLPLMKNYKVDINIDVEVIQRSVEGNNRVYIEEIDNYLIFQPRVHYQDSEIELYGKEKIILEGEDGNINSIVEVIRDAGKEREFKVLLEGLHPTFKEQVHQGFFAMDLASLLKNGWFFKAFDFFKENNIEVYGYDTLQKFKYNPNRPDFNITASSGIDWFDVKMKISFGDQVVDLKTLQKAIQRNENFVRLGDGSLGILPEDWLEENAMLFKMSDVEKDALKVSKLHFSLLDQLFQQIDNSELYLELEAKKNKLINFEKIGKQEKPKEVLADLRSYQESGFNWMCFLDEFGWGGCLADDMGLGKTLQILTFLQSRVNLKPNQTNLIVLPTSLIFNWQDEIKKFCPQLTYLVHRGHDRQKSTEAFPEYNLVLTTYGILVRDIDILKEFEFNYVILDESQVIKNPNSKRYKAVRLLNSYNRLVLTGTPVENKTFDLFAQMNFLNPGLLGSMRFFKEEFAKPIDRDGDRAKVEQLKRMVFPFLLRRTKNQVAKELPEKTESLLFCEMDKGQRKVYDAFKDLYRNKILNKISTDGLQKSRFYVLEGLLKLRQICDSPALVNNDEQIFESSSIKVETLMEHIREKTGNHKILVFSQFVQMLHLIKARVEESGIDFEYLDGSTKIKDREISVKKFQSDEKCRVFLISLKAGGFGLNLTEADYVYLVDPWWNPAVETQAIDRTHRIGQTKNVFSYKMICKDSIEEKVLKLQDRKKALASDLISAEGSFFKSLEKDDIVELFT